MHAVGISGSMKLWEGRRNLGVLCNAYRYILNYYKSSYFLVHSHKLYCNKTASWDGSQLLCTSGSFSYKWWWNPIQGQAHIKNANFIWWWSYLTKHIRKWLFKKYLLLKDNEFIFFLKLFIIVYLIYASSPENLYLCRHSYFKIVTN